MRPDNEIHSTLPVDPARELMPTAIRFGSVSIAFAREAILDFLELHKSSDGRVVGELRLVGPAQPGIESEACTWSFPSGETAMAQGLHDQGQALLHNGGMVGDDWLPGIVCGER